MTQFNMVLFSVTCLSVYWVLAPVCGRPPGTDGMDLTSFKRVYEIGEEEIVTCERGYIPSSSPGKIVCSAAGVWTKPQLVCAREFISLSRNFCHTKDEKHIGLT